VTAEATNSVEQPVDPLKSVAAAMANAADAVRDGASDAAARVQKAIPAANEFVGRCVYSSCYFLSYGVVFPTMFVANFVPGMSSVAAGLTDGAAAANDYVHELRSKTCAKKAAKLTAPPVEVAAVNSQGVEILAAT